jgi:hypothetical protein
MQVRLESIAATSRKGRATMPCYDYQCGTVCARCVDCVLCCVRMIKVEAVVPVTSAEQQTPNKQKHSQTVRYTQYMRHSTNLPTSSLTVMRCILYCSTTVVSNHTLYGVMLSLLEQRPNLKTTILPSERRTSATDLSLSLRAVLVVLPA